MWGRGLRASFAPWWQGGRAEASALLLPTVCGLLDQDTNPALLPHGVTTRMKTETVKAQGFFNFEVMTNS